MVVGLEARAIDDDPGAAKGGGSCGVDPDELELDKVAVARVAVAPLRGAGAGEVEQYNLNTLIIISSSTCTCRLKNCSFGAAVVFFPKNAQPCSKMSDRLAAEYLDTPRENKGKEEEEGQRRAGKARKKGEAH